MYKISLIFFLLFASCHAFCQPLNLSFDRKVVYKLSCQPDSTQEKKSEEMMELLLNDSLSLFRSVAKGQLDSAEQSAQVGSTSHSRKGWPSTEFHFQIIKQEETIETFDIYEYNDMFKGDNHFVLVPDGQKRL